MHGPVVRSDRLTARPFLLRTADARRRVARTRAETLPGSPAPPRAYASRSPPGPSTTRRCGRYTDLTVSRGPSSPEDRAAGRVWARHPARLRWPDQTSGIGRFVERLRSTLGPNARQSLAALGLNSATSFVAGGVLGSITGHLRPRTRACSCSCRRPSGCAATSSARSATGSPPSIHAGTFRLSLRRETVLGQNLLAAVVLTVGLSVGLAVVAKVVAVGARHRGHRRRARPRGDLDRRRRARRRSSCWRPRSR